MRTPKLLLSCFLCPALLLAAPVRPLDPGSILQFTHTAWTEKDGLPGQPRAVAQTPDGYLWIGSSAGLYRFDGVRFTAVQPRGEPSAIGASVASLRVARDGTLWIGFVSGGIGRLREGVLTMFASGGSIPEGGIAWLVEDSEGSIWASGPYGLVRFKGGEWRRVGPEMGYPGVGAQALAVDREGTLWVAATGFDFHLSDDPKRTGTILKLVRGATRFSTTGLAVPWVQGLGVAPDGAVWAAETTTWTVHRLTPGVGPETINVGASPMCVIFGKDQSLWVGLIYDGIRHVPTDGGTMEPFGPRDQLSGNIVNDALTDREGNLWFVTDTGLDRFRPNKALTLSEAQGLSPDRSMALQSVPDGSVWIFSYDYGTISRFQDGKLTRTALGPYSSSDTSRIESLFVNPQGQFWLGGNFKLAREINGRFEYLDVPDRSPPSIVEAAGESKSGDLWVTMTSPGATGQVLRRHGSEWTDVRAKLDLPAFRARVLFPDPDGRIWLGFENGEVAAIDGDRVHRYGTKDGLRGGRITSIRKDRQGRIWVSAGSGLSRLDGEQFATLTEANGLPGNSISAMLEDVNGDLWLASARGILRLSAGELERAFASKDYKIAGLLIDSQDGLRGPPRLGAPFPVATRAADGHLWFATAGGVAVIDPSHWPRNELLPAVRIEHVRADDREQDQLAALRFPSRTRSLEIDYTALSLTLPERVRFRVKLEGYDTGWRGPLRSRTATYTNLPPRDYRFRVAASNNDGVWNEEGASIAFTIVPAFYQTKLFLALCIAASAALVWAGFRWRVLQARFRLQLQFRERLAERTRIAQELHDTLLQGMLSASLQLHVAVDGVSAESPSRARLDRVLELIRKVIDEGRRAVKGLRASARGEEDLEEAFSRCGEELNTGGAVDFRVVGQGRVRPIVPAVREELYRIGREALINAFQHSGARKIEVEIEFAKKQLAISVKDDGRGIDPPLLEAGREGHWGLIGMRERAARIAATLEVFSRPGAGTEIELSIPGKIAFQPK